MPAAVAYIGAYIGGLSGAVLIMNAVAIGNALWVVAGPALSQSARRTVGRRHSEWRA